jgi:hypothetical protein
VYILPSHHQKAGKNHHIKTVNRSIENEIHFRHWGIIANKSEFDLGGNEEGTEL